MYGIYLDRAVYTWMIFLLCVKFVEFHQKDRPILADLFTYQTKIQEKTYIWLTFIYLYMMYMVNIGK